MKYTKGFFNVSNYLSSILQKEGIQKQFIVPSNAPEPQQYNDPLKEAVFSKAKGLIHRYPDRVVLTVTNRCFAYCRFCFRKKNWFDFEGFDLQEAVKYIRNNTGIREVLISGGEPFFLDNSEIENILSSLRAIKHIQIIRIGTRVISSNPIRINLNLIEMLKKYKPIWIAAHINHPDEITKEFGLATKGFIDNGIPVVSQTVLLKNINDNPNTLKELFCKLVYLGIKPYYLFGCDRATDNEQFSVSIPKALSLIENLRGHISGLCVPNFSFDLPEGGGKIILEPPKLVKKDKNKYIFTNFEGKEYFYVDV